jgi:hypothetical protein
MSKKPTRLDSIMKRIGKDKKLLGAEIGVYKGEFSAQLLENIPGLKLVLIDRWEPYSTEESAGDPSGKMCKILDEKYWKSIYQTACKNTEKYKDRVFIIMNPSIFAAKMFNDEHFDFVFIDGDHSAKGVIADIKAWLPKVKKGGFLCGHDIKKQSVQQGIKQSLKTEIEKDYGNVWFYKK